MDILVYTSGGCSWCEKIKELFDRAKVEYTEINYAEMTPTEQETFLGKYRDIESLPFTIIDGEAIGGIVPVAKLFLEKGLVSAPNKST